MGVPSKYKKNDFAKFTMQFSKQKNVTHVKCLFFKLDIWKYICSNKKYSFDIVIKIN